MNLTLIIVFFVIAGAGTMLYYFMTKGKSGSSDKLQNAYRDPNMAKIALWIELNSVNGENYDWDLSYYVKVKSNMTGAYTDVLVALIEPGDYTFVVTSRKYKKASLEISIKAGATYQLGANDEGLYFIEDSEPDRYANKYIG